MNIHLRDRLGLVVGIVLFGLYSKKFDKLTYMCRNEEGVLWAYVYPDSKISNEIVILKKDLTCSGAEIDTKTREIKPSYSDTFVRWMTLRAYKAQMNEKKKTQKKKEKRDKNDVVKRKQIKHIIADWVIDDL